MYCRNTVVLELLCLYIVFVLYFVLNVRGFGIIQALLHPPPFQTMHLYKLFI